MFSNSNSGVLMKKLLILFVVFFLTINVVQAIECDTSTQCAFLGKQLVGQKEYKSAIEFFDRAIIFDEEDYFSYAYRAKSYYYLKDYINAGKDIEKSLSIKPNSVAYGLKATLYLREGKYHEAIENATNAIELNPQYMKCYEVRGRAKANLEDYFDALKDATKAISLKDDYAKSYEVMGMAHVGLKDYPSAISDYEKAAELFKASGDRKNYKKMKKYAKFCRKRIKK